LLSKWYKLYFLKNALIIFVRHPELGKVKTRLAKHIGHAKALEIYCKLLAHTHTITNTLSVEKFVFYADVVSDNDLWNGYNKQQQKQTTNLGERMLHALEHVFALGYNKVCIIGSDCYELNTATITKAFTGLETQDVVIGPATDGGYYLLGMHTPYAALFNNILWSTDTVLQHTLNHIHTLQLSYSLLEPLTDVDELATVPAEWL
jgi:uncharacterized protein